MQLGGQTKKINEYELGKAMREVGLKLIETPVKVAKPVFEDVKIERPVYSDKKIDVPVGFEELANKIADSVMVKILDRINSVLDQIPSMIEVPKIVYKEELTVNKIPVEVLNPILKDIEVKNPVFIDTHVVNPVLVDKVVLNPVLEDFTVKNAIVEDVVVRNAVITDVPVTNAKIKDVVVEAVKVKWLKPDGSKDVS